MELLGKLGGVCLATVVSVVVLFLLTRLIGARQVSQMNLFDYIVGITIGSIAAELATELERPEEPLTALVLYGLIAWGISAATDKSVRLRTLIAGRPLVLLDGGVLSRKNLKKAHLDLNEFLALCRIGGYFDLNQIQTATLENNGTISFLPRETDRPATPSDLDLKPRQTQVQLPFVMDGQLVEENIRRAGKEPAWVHRALLRQGFRDERAVLLALWAGGESLSVYPRDPEGHDA